MRSSVSGAAVCVTLAAGVVTIAGCGSGSYSNEDLEYLSALPQRGDVAANIPTQSALAPADQAELYVATHNAVNDFNDMIDSYLGLLDAVRQHVPTTRLPTERIWGPFAATAHPGWDVQLIVDSDPDPGSFRYRLDFRSTGTLAQTGTGWLTLLNGDSIAMGGVRKGTGHMYIKSAPLRAAGFDPGIGHLVELQVTYDTSHFPIEVKLDFTSLPVDGHQEVPTAGHYDYGTQSDGRGRLTYDLSADVLAGSSGPEKLNVVGLWLGTGEGRADATVVAGDLGAPPPPAQAECWDQQLRAVYDDKPWAAATDVPGGPPGDVARCPALQPL